MHTASACTASTGLSPGPWNGKDSMGQPQLSLISLFPVSPGASSQPLESLSIPVTPGAPRELRTCWLNMLMGVSEGTGILAAPPWLLARVRAGGTWTIRHGPGTGNHLVHNQGCCIHVRSQLVLGTLWDLTWVQRGPWLLCSTPKGPRQLKEFRELPPGAPPS